MSPTLTLYANSEFSSPYVLSVYATLIEKKLPFELKTINLSNAEQFSESYARLSLSSRVPTLVDGDFSLSESSAIIEYLEEAYPRPDYVSVFPADRQLRARARQIQAWLRSDLAALREERPTTVIYGAKNSASLSGQAQSAANKLLKAADTLIQNPERNLFGDWSIADLELAVMLSRLVANGDPVPEKIAQYVRTQTGRACVQDWWARAAAAAQQA
jgi:glutathione S-transferase